MTFLGNIICYDSREMLDHLEETVYSVVDGQQRLTMIAATAILLSIQMQEKRSEFNPENDWFDSELDKVQANLRKIISVELNHYPSPRITRDVADDWKDRRYNSPIALFIDTYLQSDAWQSSSDKSIKRVDFFEQLRKQTKNKLDPGPSRSAASTFNTLAKTLSAKLEGFCHREEENTLYRISKLTSHPLLMKGIWGAKNAPVPGELENEEKELFKALLLANYLYKNTYVTRLVLKNDAPASVFAIFDRLNTAGASLNAFEAFKPHIIRSLGDDYGNHDCLQRKLVEKIEKGYVEIADRKKSDTHTRALIISMVLAYSGEEVENNTQAQFERLRNLTIKCKSKQEPYLEFLQCFSSVNDMKSIFDTKGKIGDFLARKNQGLDKGLIGTASFCLRFLKGANFTRAIPLLSLYLHQASLQDYSEISVIHFCEAIKQTAAFFALWRASVDSTKGIDSKMESLLKECNCQAINNCKPFSVEVLAEKYRKLLRETEGIKITDGKTWGDKVKEEQLYKPGRKGVAKLILMVGSNKIDIDERPDGSLVLGEATPILGTDLIAGDRFDDVLFETIEHIIAKGSSQNEYSEDEIEKLDQLWNLTLIPNSLNAYLGCKPWEKKHPIYKFCSSKNIEERNKALVNVRAQLGKKTEMELKNKQEGKSWGRMPMTEYLAKLKCEKYTEDDGEYMADYILEQCWQTLAEEWLNWKPIKH